MTEKIDLTLLGQGGYGCVYNSNIPCPSNPEETQDKKFISKIQILDEAADNEFEIAKIIKRIPNYSIFFSPIISNCKVNITEIEETLRNTETCKVLDQRRFESAPSQSIYPNISINKMKYAGKMDLKDYLSEIDQRRFESAPLRGADSNFMGNSIEDSNPRGRFGIFNGIIQNSDIETALAKIIDCHLYLLQALKLLSESGIVHLDLKYPNILFNQEQDIPIIIDFGVSQYVTKPQYDWRNLPHMNNYPCLDIILIHHLLHKTTNPNIIMNETMATQIINTIENDKDRFKPYIYPGSTEEEIQDFKNTQNDFIRKLENKQISQILQDLQKNYATWDNYSLALTFLELINIFGIDQQTTEYIPLQKYIETLTENIYRLPDNRMTIAEMTEKIKAI